MKFYPMKSMYIHIYIYIEYNKILFDSICWTEKMRRVRSSRQPSAAEEIAMSSLREDLKTEPLGIECFAHGITNLARGDMGHGWSCYEHWLVGFKHRRT